MNTKYHKVALLIPAYNPDEKLTFLVDSLKSFFSSIVIINDGSDKSKEHLLDLLSKQAGVTVINHDCNLGKGHALKTGMSYIKENLSVQGCITMDADGQHIPEDVIKLANYADDMPSNFILGVRDFSSLNSIPARSRFGNVLTCYILKFFYGLCLSDSQTGLRYIPLSLFDNLISLPGGRYEYELECLLELNRAQEAILQVPISTIYIEDNKLSHFHPLKDSIRIYKTLIKFSLSSIFCFALDITVFSILLLFTSNIFNATAISRILSGVMNFWINDKLVFQSTSTKSQAVKAFQYAILWILLLVSSGWLVTKIHSFTSFGVVGVKIIVDLTLFIISYKMQKAFIFKKQTD